MSYQPIGKPKQAVDYLRTQRALGHERVTNADLANAMDLSPSSVAAYMAAPLKHGLAAVTRDGGTTWWRLGTGAGGTFPPSRGGVLEPKQTTVKHEGPLPARPGLEALARPEGAHAVVEARLEDGEELHEEPPPASTAGAVWPEYRPPAEEPAVSIADVVAEMAEDAERARETPLGAAVRAASCEPCGSVCELPGTEAPPAPAPTGTGLRVGLFNDGMLVIEPRGQLPVKLKRAEADELLAFLRSPLVEAQFP